MRKLLSTAFDVIWGSVKRGQLVFETSVCVLVLILFPTAMVFNDLSLKSPAAILTLLALVFGGYFSSFVHYSTLRLKLTEQEEDYPDARAPERAQVDSVATLLLLGALCSVVAAILVVVAMVLYQQPTGEIQGWPAAIVTFIAFIPLLLFIFIVPLLYNVYKDVVSTSQKPANH